VTRTNLDEGLFAQLLKIGRAPLERDRSTQPCAGQVQQIVNHPLHALRAVHDALNDATSSLRMVLRHGE
jgi:hypothetical protein